MHKLIEGGTVLGLGALLLLAVACGGNDAAPEANGEAGAANAGAGAGAGGNSGGSSGSTAVELLHKATSCDDLTGRLALALLAVNNGGTGGGSGGEGGTNWGSGGAAWGGTTSAGGWTGTGAGTSWGGSAGDIGFGGTASGGTGTGPGVVFDGSGPTKTNTQFEGVDEPDFVKADAENLYVVHQRALHVVKAWPAEQLAARATATVEGTVVELLTVERAAGTELVVISRVYADTLKELAGRGELTKVTRYRLTGGEPSVLAELYYEGSYVSARRQGEQVRLVLQPNVFAPLALQPTAAMQNKAELLVVEQLLAAGKSVADLTSEELDARVRVELAKVVAKERAEEGKNVPPRMARKTANGLVITQLGCENFWVPKAGTSDLGVTFIAEFDLTEPEPSAAGAAFLGIANVMYQDEDALVLASNGWDETGTKSTLHDFAQTVAGLDYRGSGVVKGQITGSFAIDEKQGELRVVTTGTGRSGENRLVVLTAKDGALQPTGELAGLAKDETVRAVRWVGDTAYVVTFRQTDPLFAIDVSDGSKPKLLGELHIPGFSQYMHPIDANHLLTVGTDGDAGGALAGVAVQLFDVSNRSKPKLLVKHAFAAQTSSAAQLDHKGFTWLAGQGVLALPLTYQPVYGYYPDYAYTPGRGAVALLKVDVKGSKISSLGELEATMTGDQCYGDYGPFVERAIVNQDVLYAVGRGGVVAAKTNALTKPIGKVDLPNSECGSGGVGGWTGGGAGFGGEAGSAGAAGEAGAAGAWGDGGTGGAGGTTGGGAQGGT